MLVSSIGYFRDKYGIEGNKSVHHVVNQGLNEQFGEKTISRKNVFTEIFSSVKSAFSDDTKIAQKSLDMIA